MPDERPEAATKRPVVPIAEREEADAVVLHPLRVILEAIVMADRADPPQYDVRNVLVVQALGVAVATGIPAGIRLDASEPEWPVVYFELPTGQVSWHLPEHPQEYDGHSTEEKNRRVIAYVEAIQRRMQERPDGE